MKPLAVLEFCPECDARIAVRTRRADGQPFLSCTRFPSCRWADSIETRCQRLAERVAELECDLMDAYARLRGAPEGPGPASVDLSRELRALIALAHPDRWPGNHLAHEITCALTRLRSGLPQ